MACAVTESEPGPPFPPAALIRTLNPNQTMKTISTLIGALTVAAALPLAAQVTEKKSTTETTTDGTVTETTETTTTTFNPAARKKVTTYFEKYKSEPYGLPPAWVSKVKVKQIPAKWRTDNMTPGFVIPEAQRTYLYAAPTDLVQVLPKADDGVMYYVAGRNVVAVTKDYKVVDSIAVPSVTYAGLDEDDREDLKDAAEDGDDVEIQVDEDGDVDVDD